MTVHERLGRQHLDFLFWSSALSRKAFSAAYSAAWSWSTSKGAHLLTKGSLCQRRFSVWFVIKTERAKGSAKVFILLGIRCLAVQVMAMAVSPSALAVYIGMLHLLVQYTLFLIQTNWVV